VPPIGTVRPTPAGSAVDLARTFIAALVWIPHVDGEYICPGCGRTYDGDRPPCPECGHDRFARLDGLAPVEPEPVDPTLQCAGCGAIRREWADEPPCDNCGHGEFELVYHGVGGLGRSAVENLPDGAKREIRLYGHPTLAVLLLVPVLNVFVPLVAGFVVARLAPRYPREHPGTIGWQLGKDWIPVMAVVLVAAAALALTGVLETPYLSLGIYLVMVSTMLGVGVVTVVWCWTVVTATIGGKIGARAAEH